MCALRRERWFYGLRLRLAALLLGARVLRRAAEAARVGDAGAGSAKDAA